MYENFPEWYNPQDHYNMLTDIENNVLKILEKITDNEQFLETQAILNSLAVTKDEIKDMMVKYG